MTMENPPPPREERETRDRIIDACMEQIRQRGRPPGSVARLCRKLGIEERAFFSEFPSMPAVEGAFWAGTIDRTLARVTNESPWVEFNARQQFLTFLFAYLEDALGFRSLLLSRFSELRPYDQPAWLHTFRERFDRFAHEVLDRGLETGEIARRGNFSSFYPQGLYLHFRSVIAFSLQDDSQGFERTDAFVEKTVRLAFDVVAPQAFDSALDLARFFLPRGR